MDTELSIVTQHLDSAERPEDVFGILLGSQEEKLKQLNLAYRRLIPTVHPDKFLDAKDKSTAEASMRRLTNFKSEADERIRAGLYGKHAPTPEPVPTHSFVPTTVKIGKHTYEVEKLFAQGDICDLYVCKESGVERVFKIVQAVGDNDLAENESKILTHLFPKGQVEEKFYRYLPQCLDTFLLKGASKSKRRVVVLPYYKDYVSFADIVRAYPDGLDYRDVVWMFKRTLAGIGFAHTKGVIHGAVIPPHVMVHPTEHGAKIVDWCYAVKDQASHIRAISSAYKDFYPPEVFKKAKPTSQTDIYMIAKCAIHLLGGDVKTDSMPDTVPPKIKTFLTSCTVPIPARRPDDAWKLHEELDELLRKVVGKPKYRPLTMPART